jgi:hypothetical protein
MTQLQNWLFRCMARVMLMCACLAAWVFRKKAGVSREEFDRMVSNVSPEDIAEVIRKSREVQRKETSGFKS